MVQQLSEIGNLANILICKLEGKKLKISLGYHFFWTQHPWNMLGRFPSCTHKCSSLSLFGYIPSRLLS